MATSETICKFNQSGFCKFQSNCRKQHVMEICKNMQCSMVTCIYRHPRMCRYFNNFGRCKFEDSCAYLHKSEDKISELRREQEKEIDKLKKEVKDLKNQVNELQNAVNQISNSPNQTSTLNSCSKSQVMANSTFPSNCGSITMVQSNHSSNSPANLGQVIPQLDGITNSLPPAINTATHEDQNSPPQPPDAPLQCETCHETFDNEDQFNEHDRAQFCCDECGICFRTQVIADLHELEVHPNTHYANTYIPQSTKLLFSSGQPRN